MRYATRHPGRHHPGRHHPGRRFPASRKRSGPAASVVVDRISGPRATLSAHGEFDVSNSQVLCGAVLAQLDAHRRSVALDLSDVGFIDVTAIEGLLLAQRAFRSCEAALVLTNMSRQTARVVRLIDLVDALTGENEPERAAQRDHAR
jgi:anti-sigma B factor antagonist